MTFRKSILALSLFSMLPPTIQAEEYSDQFNASVIFDDDFDNYTGLVYSHYFDKLQSFGPKDYFGFNQRNNQIDANISFPELEFMDERYMNVNGQYNTGNFQLSAGYSRLDNDESDFDFSATSLGVNYFVNNNWSVGIDTDQPDEGSSITRINTKYLMQLSGMDSLGFTLRWNDFSREFFANAEYFKQLSNNRYLLLNLGANEDLDLSAGAKFYFDNSRAVSTSFSSDGLTSVGYQQFLSNDWRLSIDVNNPLEDDDILMSRTFAFNASRFF